MFFNERFEFVSEGSTALRVSQSGDGAAPLVIPNIKAPKNGYAYVYLSNESNEPVYWDDFKVSDTRGRIIEENHYYAFGLKIAGISSQKFGNENYEGELQNHYLYNDKELFEDADLNWYDYGFRNYDPQIGRFPQLDPLTWDYPYYTPYQYAGNEPIANVDLDGLEPLNILSALDKPTGALAKEVTLQTVVLQGVKKAVPAAAKTSSTLGKALGTALTKAGTSVASFSKDFWNEGVMPTVDWVNHNVNPVYAVFNGINSQFTGQDFLSGVPMSRQDGVAEIGMSLFPVGRGMKVGKAVLQGGAKTVQRGLWTLTKEGSSAVRNHKSFGTIYKSKSDGLWWAIDKTGHGGSKFKVFKETNKGLEWFKDADGFGDFIINKHKGPTGTFVPWGQLSTIK